MPWALGDRPALCRDARGRRGRLSARPGDPAHQGANRRRGRARPLAQDGGHPYYCASLGVRLTRAPRPGEPTSGRLGSGPRPRRVTPHSDSRSPKKVFFLARSGERTASLVLSGERTAERSISYSVPQREGGGVLLVVLLGVAAGHGVPLSRGLLCVLRERRRRRMHSRDIGHGEARPDWMRHAGPFANAGRALRLVS